MEIPPYLSHSFKKAGSFSSLIGEGAFELGVNLIVMIMVERSLGEAGLGTFVYLLSIVMFAGFISEFGISRYLEKEIAVRRQTEAGAKVVEKSLHAILATSLLCVGLFLITAVFDTVHTRVEENVVAYFIIAVIIPIRNINRLRIAILHGKNEFSTAASLKAWKRVFLFGTVFFMLVWRVPASYLMVGYLFSELGLMIKSRKSVQLPGLKTLWTQQHNPRLILNESRYFILTDETLDVVLYMDFLILGIFMSSSNLGLYAEASILARLFMLIPLSVKPVFRKQYCVQAGDDASEAVAVSVQASTSLLFFFHTILALCTLLYFPEIRVLVYRVSGKSMIPFYIFAEMIPGLLYFSAIVSQEPIYEAFEKEDVLQKNIMIITLLNILLNCFFIPLAGFYGAAFATSCSMFVYFILFGRNLHPIYRIDKIKYGVAGAAVYLTYTIFKKIELHLMVAIFVVAAVQFMFFYAINMFDFQPKQVKKQFVPFLPETSPQKEA